MQPLTWIVFAVLFAILVLLPEYGLYARFIRWQEYHQREQMEDALKHLLDSEQLGRRASPETIAVGLNVSVKKATKILAHLEEKTLLERNGAEIRLTPAGERWAMQVVRAHRLWERYLVDEARMPLEKIHTEAHRREHSLTETEVDALEAALGHPTVDPHGDPIPSREGQMQPQEGTPLTEWEANKTLRIVHLEDEPALAYQQIVAAGLRLGMNIRVMEVSSERILLTDGENEYRLAPAVAENVHVTSLPEDERLPEGAIPLSSLADASSAEILALDNSVQGFTRRRFLDLGLTPGTLIQPELQTFFGDPRAYRVRGTLIALRAEQASQIWVSPVKN